MWGIIPISYWGTSNLNYYTTTEIVTDFGFFVYE